MLLSTRIYCYDTLNARDCPSYAAPVGVHPTHFTVGHVPLFGVFGPDASRGHGGAACHAQHSRDLRANNTGRVVVLPHRHVAANETEVLLVRQERQKYWTLPSISIPDPRHNQRKKSRKPKNIERKSLKVHLGTVPILPMQAPFQRTANPTGHSIGADHCRHQADDD